MTERTEPSFRLFIARYGLQAKLGLIPWSALPALLRRACDEVLAAWWENLDPDEPIRLNALQDLTVAELLEVWSTQREKAGELQGRFRVVSYLRVEPEESVPVSLAEALAELDQAQLLAPESLHRIEEVCDDPPPSQG